MKTRLITIFALAALSSLTAIAQPPAGNTHIVANGDSAFVSFVNGAIAGSVNVARCGTVQQPRTCLNYIVALVPPPPPPGPPPPPPPPPIVLEQGDGVIPDGNFTGSFSQGTLALQTNTSASSNPAFHRGVGGGGTISIQFSRTNDLLQHTAGTNDMQFSSGMKIHFSGESTISSAFATGNVIVWTIPPAGAPPPSFAFANIGQHHQVQITIER